MSMNTSGFALIAVLSVVFGIPFNPQGLCVPVLLQAFSSSLVVTGVSLLPQLLVHYDIRILIAERIGPRLFIVGEQGRLEIA